LFPTSATIAPFHNEILWRKTTNIYSAIINCCLLPSTQVPICLNEEGMPVGIQIVANKNQDRLTLAVALEFEKAFGGWKQPENNAT